MNEIYLRYKTHGFTILGFICDKFSKESNASSTEIIKWFRKKYAISFPLFTSINTNAFGINNLWRYLSYYPGLPKCKEVTENWTKFLVNYRGEVVKRFDPEEEPHTFL